MSETRRGSAQESESTTFEAREQQPLDHPRLIAIWDGGAASAVLPVRGRCVIGRSREADITVDHTSVSRRHAVLEIDTGLVWEDLGSANGTRVRGRVLIAGERVHVGWGEAVEVGSTLVMVRAPHDAEKSPSTAGQPAATSSPMADVERWIGLVAHTDMSVLLLGETGVGKGYFARRIHDRSPRATGPFVHINCAALAENLLESELFGHERGAFTGAAQAKPGLLEAASGGTVFLDEVGELPLATQAKLLVALERREVLRVGALKPRPFDVRFVSATNRAIVSESAQGKFRQDLYYRLAGLPIVVPPLRERRNEIEALATALVRESAQRIRRPVPSLTTDALVAMTQYEWPGNVRELMIVLDRALLLAGPILDVEHVQAAIEPQARSSPNAGEQPRPAQEPNERERILSALEESAGNQSRAAKLLGISRRTLIHRIEEYGLPRPRK
ncbi:MAG: sigma 54-interacting transcriptional regulator [Polyangiaceae bacterium]|nr:sigma 54-interacting transcriptional regulator [Polyangiaceae bacterium]